LGPTLATVCLAIFGLFIADELHNCILCMEAMLAIPRNFKKTSIAVDGDALTLISISTWRLGFMLGTVALRVCIAVILLISGGRWLSNTSVLGDLLLNCAALVFVLELDELLYKTLVPGLVKGIVSRLQPVPLRGECMLRGLSWRPLLVLFTCMSFVAWMTVKYVEPMHHRMLDVKEAMCGGSTTNFVVQVAPYLGVAAVAPTFPATNYTDSSLTHTLLRRVARDFAFPSESPYSHDWWKTSGGLDKFGKDMYLDLAGYVAGKYSTSAWIFPDKHLYQEYMQMVDFPDPCNDILDEWGPKMEAHVLAVQFATRRFDVTKCADFADLCRDQTYGGFMVRSHCSATCGCYTNNFTPIGRSGCRPRCLAQLQLEQRGLAHHGLNQSTAARFADCADYYDPLFFNSTPSDEYFDGFELYFWKPEGTVPRGLFKQHGCAALELDGVSSNEDWHHQKNELVDALCGRLQSTNVAMKDPHYVSLRARCPVVCGCTADIAGGCPSSCERGVGATAVNVCSFGVCKAGAVLNATRTSNAMTCGTIDSDIRSSTQSQTCELLQAKHKAACCM